MKSVIRAIKGYGIKSCFNNVLSILISDACVVSFLRSGKTWLRLMLAKVISLKQGNKKINLDLHFMTLFKSTPNILISHGGCTYILHAGQDHNSNMLFLRNMFRKKKMILLVRDPRDIIVSLYHHHTKRYSFYKGDISTFIRDPEWGIKRIIKFLNFWAEEMDRRKKDYFLLLRYEDMKKDTQKELKRVFNFLGIQVSERIINEAVEYASFENMRKMELSKEFKDHRMRPKNDKDYNYNKVRKGKVGGYKEELKKEDIDYANKEIKENLRKELGYSNFKS